MKRKVVHIHQAMREDIRTVAFQLRITESELVRRAVGAYLKEHHRLQDRHRELSMAGDD